MLVLKKINGTLYGVNQDSYFPFLKNYTQLQNLLDCTIRYFVSWSVKNWIRGFFSLTRIPTDGAIYLILPFRLSDKWVKDFRTSFVVKEQRIQCYSCTEAYLLHPRGKTSSRMNPRAWGKVRICLFILIQSQREIDLKLFLYYSDWKLFIFISCINLKITFLP